MKIILGLTGASGIPIGIRLAEELSERFELYVIVSNAAKKVMEYENEDVTKSIQKLKNLSKGFYTEKELDTPFTSGSFETEGMVIAPCSMKTLSSIACGKSKNLIERAADVCLKERRKLVLVPRETPLNSIHLENMLKLSKIGVDIVPPVLGFYYEPKNRKDFIDHIVGKVLERFDIKHNLYKKWYENE